MKEKTITIQGTEVTLCYCAATENGFEDLSGKNIYDIDFKSQRDLFNLSLSAIVAHYAKKGVQPPISSDTLLYETTPKEMSDLIATTLELRMAWYGIPKVVADQLEKESKEVSEDEKEASKN